jgi:hypothetical protein
LVGDPTKGFEIDRAGVGRRASDDQLGFGLDRALENVGIVDQLVAFSNLVADHVEPFSRHRHR